VAKHLILWHYAFLGPIFFAKPSWQWQTQLAMLPVGFATANAHWQRKTPIAARLSLKTGTLPLCHDSLKSRGSLKVGSQANGPQV